MILNRVPEARLIHPPGTGRNRRKRKKRVYYVRRDRYPDICCDSEIAFAIK